LITDVLDVKHDVSVSMLEPKLGNFSSNLTYCLNLSWKFDFTHSVITYLSMIVLLLSGEKWLWTQKFCCSLSVLAENHYTAAMQLQVYSIIF